MKRMSLADARRLAATADAYSWYCQAKGVPDPEMDMDFSALDQHADAWAWARTNWRNFLNDTGLPDSQFLIDLFHKGEASCRSSDERRMAGKEKTLLNCLQAGRTPGPEQRRGQRDGTRHRAEINDNR